MAIDRPARRFMPLACLAVALALPRPAGAQQGWEHSVSLYGWFTGLSSEVETRFGDVDTELGFGDIWEQLDIAGFATVEARNGPWALLADLNYARLTTEEDTPAGLAFEEVEVETRLTILSAVAAYSIVDRPDLRLEVAGGLRHYDLDIDVDLRAAAASDRSVSLGDSWADPLVGMRLRAPIAEAWFVNAFADVGGFGIGEASDLSWQAYAGLGYRINDRWSVRGGYRHLSIDRNTDGRDVWMDLYGPLLGVTARF